MLVRKLRQKYIDNNPAFATISDESLSTCNLLQNNYLNTSGTVVNKRYNPNSSIEYGSVPLRQTSMHNTASGRTRN